MPVATEKPVATKKDANVTLTTSSPLGWMGLVSGDAGLRRVTFGHASRSAAVSALTIGTHDAQPINLHDEALLARLAEFADGGFDEFHDVELDLEGLSKFQRRVIEMCRRIPYGTTCSYGILAQHAGNSGSARAVGSVMAANRWPLIVPCHRVVQANGNLGAYSAPQGVRMKRRLLDMEAAACVAPV